MLIDNEKDRAILRGWRNVLTFQKKSAAWRGRGREEKGVLSLKGREK